MRAASESGHERPDGKVTTGEAVLVEWGRSHDEAVAAPVTEAFGCRRVAVGGDHCRRRVALLMYWLVSLWIVLLLYWLASRRVVILRYRLASLWLPSGCTGLRAVGSSTCCTGLRAVGSATDTVVTEESVTALTQYCQLLSASP